MYLRSQSRFDELTCCRLKFSEFPASRDAYRWRDRATFRWHSDLPRWAKNRAPSRYNTGPKRHSQISCSRSLSCDKSKCRKSKLDIIRQFIPILFLSSWTTHIVNGILHTQSVGEIRWHIWRVTSDHTKTTGMCIDQRSANRCTFQQSQFCRGFHRQSGRNRITRYFYIVTLTLLVIIKIK